MSRRIRVTQSSMPEYEEYIEEIRDLWESRQLTNMGSKHQKLELLLARYLDTPHVSLFANGHLALESAIEAFDLSGEVITTPFTFPSTVHAIVRRGLTPVFCDIDPDDLTIDVEKLESLITESTCAIIPVHVYGNMCDVLEIDRIAKLYGLKVIYDAAHAFGVKLNGISAANFGNASVFSFHATKVFNTVEGGAVTFRDSQLTDKLYGLKNFGIMGPDSVKYVGGNAKMNELQAAMGICNLRHIEGQIDNRRRVVLKYREYLDHRAGIGINREQKGVESNFAYFPVVFDEKLFGHTRDQVYERLNENNIGARKYFYPPVTEYECYRDRFRSVYTPVAEYISDRVLCLPVYAELEDHDIERICRIIAEM